MFNNYKKNKSKKLPKYAPGGVSGTRTLSNGNEVSDAPLGGTQNFYNEKRGANINAGQVAAYGAIAANAANQFAQNQNSDEGQYTKSYNTGQIAGDTVTQGLGTINPLIGMGTSIRKPITQMVGNEQGANRTASNWMSAPHESAMKDMTAYQSAENDSQRFGSALSTVGDITGMSKMRQMFSYGTGNDEKTTGFWGKYNDLTGISSRNNQEKNMQLESQQFAMGGVNMQPNAEVEKQENTLNPDGTTTQFNGPSHEQGGIATNLDPGTIIFSDKLKHNGKTFAKLNKINLTDKEDKILKDPNSSNTLKQTAQLMKDTKLKNSISLFKIQEDLKQSKLQNYAKRIGTQIPSTDNESMEPQGMSEASEGEYAYGGIHIDPSKKGTFTAAATKHGLSVQEFASQVLANKDNYSPEMVKKANFAHNAAGWKHEMGGVQQYPNGGLIDNTKFTPGQRQQAYSDSMTLYKSGFDKNIPNWQQEPGFNDAISRLHALNNQTPSSTDKRQITYNSDYLMNHSVPYAKPVAPVTSTNKLPVSKTKPTYANYNMPMQGLERPDNFNPQLQQVPANSPNTIKTNIVTGPNVSYKEYKQGNQVLDRGYFNPSTQKEVEIQGFRYGGQQLPKFENGDMFGYTPTNNVDKMRMQQAMLNNQNRQSNQSSWITPEMQQTSSDELVTEGYNSIPVNNQKTTQPFINTGGSRRDQELYDAELARMNSTNPNGNQNWFNRNSDNLYQAGFGVAQNLGQLAYLGEQGKKFDTQQYYDYNPSTLNDTAALRDAEQEARRAEYNIRGASGGNAGTYLANRIGLNTSNVINKDRIRQQYANANAGILNRANEVNLANKYSVDDINARNKGAALTNYYSTLGSVGTNVAQGMKDNRQMGMDNESIQLMSEFYNSPEAQKMFAKYKKNKSTKSNKG